MSDELAALRAEVVALRARMNAVERAIDVRLLPLIDRIDDDVADLNALHDHFVIPAILLIAADGDLERLREWMAATARALHDPETDKPSLLVLRVAYWRRVLAEKHPWLGFEADGWMAPDED